MKSSISAFSVRLTVATIGCLSIQLVAQHSRAEMRFEDFATDPEPRGWRGLDNRDGENDYGWTDTNHVFGTTTGEVGGAYGRDDNTALFSYYGIDIGSIDLSTDSFSFNGTAKLLNPNFDSWNIGYFTSADGLGPQVGEGDPGWLNNFIGFYSDDRYVRPRWAANGNNADNPPQPANRSGSDANPYTFSMSYDPNGASGNGELTGNWGGTPFTFSLPPGRKDEFNNLTDFGLYSRNNHREGLVTMRQTWTFFDDITFFVPDDEPPSLIGDYNENGSVDAADYVVWRDNNGTSNALPNRDPSSTGPIGALDYQFWAANFGKTSGGGSTSVANQSLVPEPSSIVTFCLALILFQLPRKREGFSRCK